MDKVYEASLLLGARSDTDDADGMVQTVPEDARTRIFVQSMLATLT